MNDTITHEMPVWRERADFMIVARLDPPSADLRWQWEQLWARQVGKNRFVVCCIPLFLYDLALGDEVETGLRGKDRYVVQRVIRRSGHYTFRVWFHDAAARAEVQRELERLGCLLEWRWQGGNLLAVDAASEDQAQRVADYLWKTEQTGCLEYETGRTE